VKLEQASQVAMWTPTRPDNGEGSTGREETRAGTRNSSTNEHLIRGYTFGPHRYKRDSHWYLEASPSKKAWHASRKT
jgi:hypothetical protein